MCSIGFIILVILITKVISYIWHTEKLRVINKQLKGDLDE